MFCSMTAFARLDRETELGSFTWEMRAVNHRYLEVTVRLPEELRHLEGDVREKISAHLGRGKVECLLRFKPGAAAGLEFTVDSLVLDRLAGALETVVDKVRAVAQPSSLDLLRWPGVLKIEDLSKEALQSKALALLDHLIKDYQSSRQREGEKLKELMARRCDVLVERVAQVRERLPVLVPQFRQKLLDRLATVKQELDPQRLEQEMVIYAQRVDVAEELDRLSVHIDETRRIFTTGGAVGRRLDFLMQEFNREANTLASKSSDVELTRLAVDMKVLIEQMREQVQNIE